MTFDEIVDDLINRLTDEAKQQLQEMSEDEVRGLHHSWGMNIRNFYNLWMEDHPLTKQWYEDHLNNNMKEHIINGVDHHPCHPDAVSDAIIKKVWEKVNGRA